MKVIRVSDGIHTLIKDAAAKDKRTINAQAEVILMNAFEGGSKKPELDKLFNDTPEKIISEATPLGSPVENECCNNPDKPCSHWNWHTGSGNWVNRLSGRVMEVE